MSASRHHAPLGRAVAIASLATACVNGDIGDLRVNELDPSAQPSDCVGSTPDVLRRLTGSQYKRSVESLTGIAVPPALANEIASTAAPVGGFENDAGVLLVRQTDADVYQRVAEYVARERFVGPDVEGWVGCAAEDTDCLRELASRLGRLAYRRPLGASELDRLLALALSASEDERLGAWTPFSVVTEALLQSPHFVLVVEPSQGDTSTPVALDGYQIATRLALALWDEVPDGELLDEARDGRLDTDDGRAAVVARMLDDARSRAGLMRFASAWLEVDGIAEADFANAGSEQQIQTLRADARREVDALIAEHFVEGDLRDIFVTSTAKITPALAAVYGVDVDESTDADALVEVTFDEASRRGGLFGTAGFLATFASGSHASTVRRGAYVRRVALCSEPPPPPANVPMNDPTDREHAANPACWGCHQMLDPVGWGLDRYGPSGELRATYPDGSPLKDAGFLNDVEGSAFTDARELGRTVVESPAFGPCVAEKTLTWLFAKQPDRGDQCAADAATESLVESSFDTRTLVERFVSSRAFAERVPPGESP